MSIGLFDSFKTGIYPLITEGVKVLFVMSIVSGACVIMKCNGAEGVKKIKMATIGYTIIKCAYIYINFVDKIISHIHL